MRDAKVLLIGLCVVLVTLACPAASLAGDGGGTALATPDSGTQAVGISERGIWTAGAYHAQRARVAHNPTHEQVHRRISAYIRSHLGVDRWRTLVLHVHPYRKWRQAYFSKSDWPIVRCIIWHESGGSSTVVWGLMGIHSLWWRGFFNPHNPFANLTYGGWLHSTHHPNWRPWGSWFTGTIWYR